MDENRIQPVLEAINRTQSQMAQVSQQLAAMDRANVAANRTQRESNSAIAAGATALRSLNLVLAAGAAAATLFGKSLLGSVDALAKEARALEVGTERLSSF